MKNIISIILFLANFSVIAQSSNPKQVFIESLNEVQKNVFFDLDKRNNEIAGSSVNEEKIVPATPQGSVSNSINNISIPIPENESNSKNKSEYKSKTLVSDSFMEKVKSLRQETEKFVSTLDNNQKQKWCVFLESIGGKCD